MQVSSVRNPDGIWINTQCFREAANHFVKYGHYTPDPWGSPAWFEYWAEERRRCIEGYSVGGAKITGDHYFYLNYCPIQKVEDAFSGKSQKIKGFPDFWDGDYNYFWVREIAKNGLLKAVGDEEVSDVILKLDSIEQGVELKSLYESLHLEVKIEVDFLRGGYNLIVGKSRRKGYSYKNASVAVKNYYTKPELLTIFNAYEKKFLYPKGIMTMAINYINFINQHTGWAMPSDVVQRTDHIKASYIEYQNGIKTERGFMSEIMALTCKDNADVNRGKDAEDIIIEESGAFGTPGLLKDVYLASQDCVMAGSVKTGMITIFGCVCKGTKVWNNKGELVNIEDITKESGIIGYASKGTIEENISWLQPPAQKECLKIITENGNSIECSTDHPLLSKYKNKYKGKSIIKTATFIKAEDLKVGDYLLEVRQMPKFGDKRMWNPRLVGLLIGDGYYGTEYASSQLCISEPELLDYINTIDVDYKIYEGKSSDTPYFRYITLQATQKQLRLLGIQGQSCKMKRLPNNIWDYDKNSVAELLAGLFDADGYVGTQGKRKKIALTSVVFKLLEEVKIQLYKLGIKSKIYKRKHESGVILKSNVTRKNSSINTDISYSLEICDLNSIRNFKKHIKLIVNKKQNELNSWNLDITKNEDKQEYEYVHTIEKGDYFIHNNKLEYLKSTKIISIENIGMQDIYNLSAEYTHTYITNNFISHNTSGDMEGGTADYADMYSRPEAFGMLPFNNIWDEGAEKTKVGFFHPYQWNNEGYYDKQGNSDIKAAINLELETRKKLIDNGATSSEIQRRMQEKPLGPREAFGTVSNNTFPVLELRAQLEKVKSLGLGKIKGTPVSLSIKGRNEVEVKPILDGKIEPIVSYVNLPKDLRGCPVIYEFPVEGTPRGLYKIGYDPIDQEDGTSLAAICVYKGVHIGSFYHSILVAEYIGRYEDPDDIDKTAEMLAILYNTTIMHENMVTGVKNYFRRIKRLDLLAYQPDRVISKNVKQSKVARVYGCHMSPQLKDAGERYVKIWLNTVLDYDENGNAVTVIDKIYSQRLLEELISYNRKGNYDLVSSLFMCMFQVEEEELGKVYDEKIENKNAKKLLEMMEEMYK